MNEAERAAFGDRLRAELMSRRFQGNKKAAYTAAQVNPATFERALNGETTKPGTLPTIINNLWPEAQGDPDRIPEIAISGNSSVSHVGGALQDGGTLLFRRPEGLSDEAWEKLQKDQEDHWEWLLDRASRER